VLHGLRGLAAEVGHLIKPRTGQHVFCEHVGRTPEGLKRLPY
jgi:predicted NBD/HSP70 family sugar kinase